MHNFKNTIPDKLDPRVMTVALFVGIVEFELFTMSKGVVKTAGSDAWICVVLGGVIAIFLAYLLVKLAARFPNENFFQYNRRVWGKYIAFVIAIAYLIYWFTYLVLLWEDVNEANKLFFLRETPSIVPLAFFGIAAALSALYGLTALIRFFQISFPFIIIPLTIIFALSIAKIEITSFLPILSNGITPVLKGSFNIVGALQGLELILFLGPFLNDVTRSVKPVLLSIGVLLTTVMFQLTAAVGLLGVESVNLSIYPGVDSITVIELPGFPVQRFELFLTFPWIFGVFTTICLMVYLSSYGIMQIFNLKRKRLVCFLVSALTIAASYLFPNTAVEQEVRNSFIYATLLFVYAIPILTLVAATIRSKRG